MSFFKDFGDTFADVLTFGGLSKKKASKINAGNTQRSAMLNFDALQADAQAVTEIAKENSELALKDADAVLRIGELNAEVLDADAEAVRIAADAEAATVGLVGRRRIGLQKAQLSSSGVRLQGSPLVLLSEAERVVKQDVDNTMRTGRIRAERLLSQADITREEADIRFKRYNDTSDLILKQGDLEAKRIRERADIVLETGFSSANAQIAQGQSLLMQGVSQGISTALQIGF